jgi:hypothetical protein
MRITQLARTRLAARPLLAAVVAVVAVSSVLQAQQAPAPVPRPRPVTPSTPLNRAGRQVSLYDQLRVGLKATTKSDFAFINLVVLRVNEGKLPRRLVDSTFLWARNRYKSHPGSSRLRPMVYFQPALIERAKKVGVLL